MPETFWLVAVPLALVAALAYGLGSITIKQYEAGLRYRRGRFAGVLPAGKYWYWRRTTEIRLFDLRKQLQTVPGQELLSADNVALKVSVLVAYSITEPVKADQAVAEYQQHLYAAVQLALREKVASMPVEDFLAQREPVAKGLLEAVAPAAAEFGISVESINLKDVMFPGNLKEIFAGAARAKKEGQAALERARGEMAALRSLSNAARMIEGNPALMQLRTLLAFESGNGKSGNTLVVGAPQPFPPSSARANGDAPNKDSSEG